ncbi:MAG: YitT family protein, partial [Mediterranea sp.]|nr:YitT family protein [Mediterranea sp.]
MKITKKALKREAKDYAAITFGLMSYALGWAAFLLPYQITTGGVTGISAIIYYATGVPIQWTYMAINAVLMAVAIRLLGPRFTIKTTYAIFTLTFLLWFFQFVVNNYVDAPNMTTDGRPLILGPGQDFMACIIGAALCGAGLGIVFNSNGSTGGTDIIAAVVNKYKDVAFGRMIMLCDVFIISSCYFVFHDWRRVIFGFVTLLIIGVVLDYIVNSARQSVQFLIFSQKYGEIADRIIRDTHRGVTVLDGTGWYSKHPT